MRKEMKFCVIICALLLMFNCSTESIKIDENFNELATETDDNSSVDDSKLFQKITANKSVTFNTSNKSIDTDAKAETIFGNELKGWNNSIASISDNKLKIRLQAKAGTKGAMTSRINVGDGSKYRLTFNVKFAKGFDFSKGGKVGFGFFIGEGVTGGKSEEATQENRGGSFRVMWRTDNLNNGKPYFYPYVYYKDMKGTHGSDFKTENNSYVITHNKWYRIRLTINVNTGANKSDGYAKMQVSSDFGENYTKVWENDNMRWTGNSKEVNRKVKDLSFHVFRGGADSSWDGEDGTQSVYFDSLSWERLAK